jgi:5-methylcytosine-specific restriction endonuclease McrA
LNDSYENVSRKIKVNTKVSNREFKEEMLRRKNGIPKKNSKYKNYILSKHWRKKRKRKLREQNYQCQNCKTKENLQVHHKHYRTLFNEKLSDLVVLCKTCHEEVHGLLTEEKIEMQVQELFDLERK